MSDKKKESSCTNNHEVQRRTLRDNGLPSRECPNCGWLLHPARKEDTDADRLEQLLSSESQWLTPLRHFDNDTLICPECYAVVNDNFLSSHKDWHVELAKRLEGR